MLVLVSVLVLKDWETKVEYSLRSEQISLKCRPELSKQQLLSRSFTESFFKTFPVEAERRQILTAKHREEYYSFSMEP